MLIAVDENVPAAREAFGQFGEIRTVAGRALRRSDLAGVDALVVRSVTRVDAGLLEGTPVRFVGTATIGTDHLDLPWLHRAGIRVADAAGSNSRSVAEYVLAALLELRSVGALAIEGESIGIVGAGRIGTLVAAIARALGMEAVEYDPPRAHRERGFVSASAGRVHACRVVTLHVPLTIGCFHPTWHLVDAAFLERMRSDAWLINTSRGAVAHRADLALALRRRLIAGAVLDVWEGEPEIPHELIDASTIATPHIAGYSLDGKVGGTAMIADALARFLGAANVWSARSVLTEDAGTITLTPELAPLDAATEAMRCAYDIRRDDSALRQAARSSDETSRRAAFDELRRRYPVRREAAAWRVEGVSRDSANLLSALGFRVVSADPGA